MKRAEPYSLLIADDDDSFREVLRSIFEPWFSLLEAVSGEQAIDIIECEQIDLLVLDMHMDELTGIETIRIVKNIEADLPCILVTADAMTVREEALNADAWSVLPKPVRKRELLDSVSTALDSTYGDPGVFSGYGSLN